MFHTFFESFFFKELSLKNIKINSKLQLNNFFEFITKEHECEKLTLEDIYIELIIQNEENDNNYNELNQYFYYSKGKIKIKNFPDDNIKIKQLKLIDSPLFALTEDIFNDTDKYKEILIDVDNNSLLNPDIITKLRIKEGLIDICYDLDSYKINIDDNKDYIEYIEYIINKIINNNNKYRKIKFKNFDINKIEYIIEDNNNNIDENKLILNDKEKVKKNNYEKFINNIKNKIKNIKLNNINDIIFNNCTNDFIELILLMINNNLNLFKIKKCTKNYFNINSISSFNIHHLFLFDTPINIKSHCQFHAKILTIKINGLEYYCNKNNIIFNKTTENIIKLIEKDKLYEIINFEMNTLPIIMSFLFLKKHNQKKYSGEKDKIYYIKGLENKIVKIKTNSIYNSLELNNNKTKYESYTFNYDIEYISFFKGNKINTIILENNTIKNYLNKEENNKNKTKKYKLEEETLINIMNSGTNNFKLDFKTLNNSILNKNFCSFSFLLIKYNIYYKIPSKSEISKEEKDKIDLCLKAYDSIKNIFLFLTKSKSKTTFIINNIKERKEFYILLCIYDVISKNDKKCEKIMIRAGKQNDKQITINFYEDTQIFKEILEKHFLKTINEENEDVYSKINYYYISEEEIEIFGEPGKEKQKISFKDFNFKIEYSNNNIFDILLN